jgi:hypothetical protein
MSEFTNLRENRTSFRRQLLATVSAIALIGVASGEVRAADDDGDQPSLWIELGGQLSHMNEGQEAFAPVFPHSPPRPSIFEPSQKFERLPLYSIDETGKITFEPAGSDLVLSASVRYGRSGSDKHVRQQTYPVTIHWPAPHSTIAFKPTAARFADTAVQNDETHLLLDFQVGKDVGLGMFGRNGSSIFSAGVRFAQFSTRSNIALKSDPDWRFVNKYSTAIGTVPKYQPYHSNAGNLIATRSFHGIGPSLSWSASAPLVGSVRDGELSFDWNINAAVLFGRQKANTQHYTIERYKSGHNFDHGAITYHNTPPARSRARTITVPNVGAFAGASWRIENFKISAGYRADLFFSAMDGGIDTRKSENVGFYGPFASVSVGLGG